SFVKTLQSHRSGICAYDAHPITTSRLEAGNVSIELLRRRARGFRDMAYFKLKILQLNTEDAPSFLYQNMHKTSCQSRLSSVGKP
ncbi:MAG: transposase, partial [Sulfuricella sp.]